MDTKISEIEEVFKSIFTKKENALVNTIDTVYEKSHNKEYYKLVISINELQTEDTTIIHTKFIFKTDLKKVNLIENSFIYLYDINCIYHKKDFDSISNLKTKIEDIIESSNFGKDLTTLSNFIDAPSMFLNYYMKKNNITDYSIFEVKYEPKFKTTPCEETTFDFKININNNYNIGLSIHKVENEVENEVDIYRFQFKFMDEITTEETNKIDNIHFFIGSNIAKILDKKLKNK